MIRGRRRRLPVVATLAALAGLALTATTGPVAPAGAVDPGWTLTIDDLPEVATSRPVRITGSAKGPLQGLVGIAPVRTVTVTLTPTTALPEGCTAEPITRTVAPSGGRYAAELTPPCNGPYRVEVTARTDLSSSGSPRTATLGVADPGPAPPAPSASPVPGGVAVAWATTGVQPDLVGWTVLGGTREQRTGPTVGRVVDAAGPGAHSYRLVARRWGAQGPGGAEVASDPSSPTAVTVDEPTPAPAPPPSPATEPIDPPASRGGADPPAASTPAAPPSTPPRTTAPRGRRTDDPLPAGYTEELPYGVPDDAIVPGADPAPGADASGDDERAAGTSPSARLVRTSEPTEPGLIAPFAVALVLLTVAVHVSAHLRRTATR